MNFVQGKVIATGPKGIAAGREGKSKEEDRDY
jgi:hypothetical protein